MKDTQTEKEQHRETDTLQKKKKIYNNFLPAKQTGWVKWSQNCFDFSKCYFQAAIPMNNYKSFLVIWKRWEESTQIPSDFWATRARHVVSCWLFSWQINFIMHANSYCLVSRKMLMQKCNLNNNPYLSGNRVGNYFWKLDKNDTNLPVPRLCVIWP